ncbi:MAG: twin-arginine translocation signal domain-containing protein, partial [Chlorobiales bacterium]|nr:twin-arginine translocation signal domain-containing protein [Chlorobiales bacterium]
MKRKITRRQFLKAVGAFGGLALLRPAWDSVSELTEAQAQSTEGKVMWVPSICNFCSSFCDIKVAVKEVDGVKRAVKIDGNPNSPLNRGKICARGQAGLRQLYDPDRLKQPLIRVEGSKRGEWNFRAATWDEAYDYIIQK